MTRRIRNAAFALCAAATAAAPLAAGPVYLPIALHETDGGFVRNTDVWVTNPDTAIQGFVVRYLVTVTDGTVRTEGDETGPYYLAPGESRRFSELVPAGFRGMLEMDGATMLQFNGALTVRTLEGGAVVSEAEVPVLTQIDLAAPGASLTLQAWERVERTITTNLGIVNMGQAAAHCTVDVRQKDGLLIIQGVGINLLPLTVVQFDDALGILDQSTVPAGARAIVSCNQPFWAFSSLYNDQTGAAEFLEPSSTIGSSTLVKPAGDGGGGGGTEPDAVVFELPGEFLNCNPCDHWQYGMNTGGQSFREIIMDFDVHVGSWDPRRPNGFHNVVWIQNGQSWGNMIAYLNSKGTQGRMTFQVNDGVGQEQSQNPGMNVASDYHIRYEYNLVDHFVKYEIFQNGSVRTHGQYGISHGVTSIRPGGFFAAFGGQSAAGPEAATPHWRFSNLVAQFVP